MPVVLCYVPKGINGRYEVYDMSETQRRAAIAVSEITGEVRWWYDKSETLNIEASEELAAEVVDALFDVGVFPYFVDEHKPQWAKAVANALETRGLTDGGMKDLLRRLGGGFGDAMKEYVSCPTPAQLMRAACVADSANLAAIATAVAKANRWSPVDAVDRFGALVEKYRGNKLGWSDFIEPELIHLEIGFPGFVRWYAETKG